MGGGASLTAPEGGLVAAVLAGGQSRRMGRDKSLIPVEGVPMIERVVRALRPAVERIIIIANGDLSRFEFLGLPVYPDLIPGMGPLSGLYTAFERTGADEVLLAACDMPWISETTARLIAGRRKLPGEAVIPRVGGREQGLFALYRRRALEKFHERVLRADIQFDEFRRGLDRIYIEEEEFLKAGAPLAAFENVNSPEDLNSAKR
ncbi:MAG: molybdenum cofactor guanylyltransferase [Nitrospinae bacterium]|nr:molybdenum cofactor guanylyltransferase [Nitrospinota bacterium]